MSRRRLSQAELARKLDVSVSTFKRWLARGDFPFSAVLRLLDEFRISLPDHSELLDVGVKGRPTLRPRQEEFLTSHPQSMYVLLLIFIGFGTAEIRRALNLSQFDLDRHLRSLVARDMIYLGSRGRPIPLVRGPFRWNKDSLFSGRFARKALRKALSSISAESPRIGLSDDEPSMPFLKVYEFYLARQTASAYALELNSLLEKYYAKARLERDSFALSELRPVSGVISASYFDLWKAVLWD